MNLNNEIQMQFFILHWFFTDNVWRYRTADLVGTRWNKHLTTYRDRVATARAWDEIFSILNPNYDIISVNDRKEFSKFQKSCINAHSLLY